MVVQAYILVQTNVGKAAEVASAIGAIQGVTLAEDVTGPYDVIVRAEAVQRRRARPAGRRPGADGARHHPDGDLPRRPHLSRSAPARRRPVGWSALGVLLRRHAARSPAAPRGRVPDPLPHPTQRHGLRRGDGRPPRDGAGPAAPYGRAGRHRRRVGPAGRSRCGAGVQQPPGLSHGSECFEVNGVGWFAEEAEGGYLFTTIGRPAFVEVARARRATRPRPARWSRPSRRADRRPRPR